MVNISKNFIERNEGGKYKQEILEGISKIERQIKPDKLSIEELVENITKSEYLEDSLITEFGQVSTLYTYFKCLIRRASIRRLEQLTEHSNYIVECYAFAGLIQKSSKNLFKIILTKLHLSDIIKIRGLGYRGRIKVADFFLNEGISHLTEEQKDLIVEETLKKNYDFLFLPEYLRNILPEERNYKKIKKWVIEYNNLDALVALAKYKKEDDLHLIQNFAQDAPPQFLWAVENFPHTSFWKDLLDIHEKGILGIDNYSPNNRNLYRVIAIYHNIEVLEVLTSTFDRINDKYLLNSYANVVFLAVREYQDGFYDKLLLTLWKEYNQTNLEIFKYLLENYETPTLDLVKKTLNNPEKIHKILSNFDNFDDFDDFDKGSEALADEMIGAYIKKDKNNAIRAIGKNITMQNVNSLRFFTNFATELLEKAFIKPLFQRFSLDKNYHVYCEIAKCLLKYNSSEINEKLLKIYLQKPYLLNNSELKEILKVSGLI